MGATILPNYPNISVNVKKPDVALRIEIREDAVYMMAQVIQGAGGMPIGSNGKSLLMLSGGIDSPVAGYLFERRDARLRSSKSFSE